MNILKFMIPKSLVEYIDTESTVRQALEKMRFHRYAAIPVIDKDGRYVGTLRNDDLLKYFFEAKGFAEAERTLAADIAESEYNRAVYHSATMNELIEQIKEHNFVPVVDDRGCFIGIILRRDILNFLLGYYEESKDANTEKTGG